MKLEIPIIKGRYDCDECGCIGSVPTHKPECSRSLFRLTRLRRLDLQAKFIRAFPYRRRFVPMMSNEQLVSALYANQLP